MTALSEDAPGQPPDRAAAPAGGAVRAMLEAGSVALVGASPRVGSFGRRMLDEVSKSRSRPRIYPVNPRYDQIDGARCYASLADLPEPAELTLLAVPDSALEQQLALAAAYGSRAAVIFGNAYEDDSRPLDPGTRPGLRQRLAAIARSHAMALCGAGCMGFVNVSHGLRAIGYTEADPLPAGPVALVTHSGSVFSALLRARRGFGFTLAVSSGQELVTAAPAYLDYALDLPGTRVLGLVLEAVRDGGALRGALAGAARRDIPVVLLAVGGSAAGRTMVAAHSGALAGSDGGWEALARAYGVHRVADLAEFTDALELFSIGRRPPVGTGRGPGADSVGGIATVHDSGLERAHIADLAESLGVPFAPIGPATKARLAALLDAGLAPANPLDVWGTGADTRQLFADSLLALADDPHVAAVALAVDLVHELDGDDSYPLAMLDVAERTDKPLAVLSNVASAIDAGWASRLRASGIPVLEGARSGLLALRHLLDHAARPAPPAPAPIDDHRRGRGAALLASDAAGGAPLLDLLAEYGFDLARALAAADVEAALAAAADIGYPVVLKTDEPAVQHKSDVGGVLLDVAGPDQLRAGYLDLAGRLGPRVLVCQSVPPGVELALGLTADPELGPLVVVGAGGVLVELLCDRAVALPPVSRSLAGELVESLRVGKLLEGVRGARPASIDAVTRAIVSLSDLAVELGDQLEALDINPLICGPDRAVAVDVLAITRSGR